MQKYQEMQEITMNIRLTQEETNELYKYHITNTETETVIKYLLKSKRPGPDGFTYEFYKTFKKLMPTLLILFFKTQKERFPNTFHVNITLTPKSGDSTRKL